MPPASPSPGACYIVGSSPTGAWTGHAGAVAGYTAASWRFMPPIDGLCVLVRTTGVDAVYRTGAWEIGLVRAASFAVDGLQVVGAQDAAIANPAGGATVDTEARTAIGSILTALRGHGLIAP